MDEHAQRLRRTFDAAADSYDAEPLAFWSRVGTRAVERLRLPGGARVLDVPCGSGASLLPAARAVGPDGSVLGVDLAERLLALARAKVEAAGLANVELVCGDMRELDFPAASFDAVVCVFGIFFVPDPVEQTRLLWRLVRPGGTLAITTWAPGFAEPASDAFRAAVARVRPELVRRPNPWETLTTPAAVVDLYARAGIDGAGAVAEDGKQALRSPEDAWTIFVGSGFRGTLDALADDEREGVRAEVLAALERVDSVRAGVVHAAAVKD